MKTTGVYKVWQIVYPVGIYYVVSSVAFFMLGLFMGNAEETYMLRQMICAALTIPFVYAFCREDRQIDTDMSRENKSTFYFIANPGKKEAIFTGMLLGIGVNNVIAMTPLMEHSPGFSEANNAFFAGGVVFELFGSCLVIPFAEELLYRGVVYRRLRLLLSASLLSDSAVPCAVIGSALIFGLMHMNLVQFLYAGILGPFLAFEAEYRGLYAAVLGHIAANAAAVVRQETGWLSFACEPTAAGILCTAAVLAAALGLLGWQIADYRRTGEEK